MIFDFSHPFSRIAIVVNFELRKAAAVSTVTGQLGKPAARPAWRELIA
jgi:hypothetical protein